MLSNHPAALTAWATHNYLHLHLRLQGVVVHLPKGGDAGDCSNYRPLKLLPVIDKLFAKLLSDRIARAVCLHDQQYAFPTGRGTLNPLQDLLAVVRRRTQANQAMYACFFDAA